jgi:hypothetical protein
VGDRIGVYLNLQPPARNPNPKTIQEGSSVSFYKNGSLVLTYSKLKQVFYCFAVSLYNYSQVEVITKEDKGKIEHYQHYFKVIK